MNVNYLWEAAVPPNMLVLVFETLMFKDMKETLSLKKEEHPNQRQPYSRRFLPPFPIYKEGSTLLQGKVVPPR